MFGSEEHGLSNVSDALLLKHECVKIPIVSPHVRSYNLAVSASIAMFEVIRQREQLLEASNKLEA